MKINALAFSLFVLVFHLIFQWLNNTQLWPFCNSMKHANALAVKLVFNQSNSLLNLLGLNFYNEHYTFYMKAIDGTTGWMEINSGCTPLRAWFYWLLIMLIFPGLWKHKLYPFSNNTHS